VAFLGIDKREEAWFYEMRRGEVLVMNRKKESFSKIFLSGCDFAFLIVI
jgi:hypothetical protein